MRRADKALSGLLSELGRPTNHAEGILLFDALSVRNDRLRQENDLLREAWQANGTELRTLKERHERLLKECGECKALLDRAYHAITHEQNTAAIARQNAEHMRGLMATAREREATAQAQARDMTRIIDGLRTELALARTWRPDPKAEPAVLRERGRRIEMGENE